MSGKISSDVEKKLAEYGMIVLNDYPMDDEKQHTFILEYMILFLTFDDKSLAISFHAGMKPEVAAQNLLILEEIKSISKIDILDSFIINNRNKVVSGEAAFELLEKSNRSKILVEHLRSEEYIRILQSAKCFDC